MIDDDVLEGTTPNYDDMMRMITTIFITLFFLPYYTTTTNKSIHKNKFSKNKLN